jgi:hypothetical protein
MIGDPAFRDWRTVQDVFLSVEISSPWLSLFALFLVFALLIPMFSLLVVALGGLVVHPRGN